MVGDGLLDTMTGESAGVTTGRVKNGMSHVLGVCFALMAVFAIFWRRG